MLLQTGAALLIQIRASFITDQGSYYKLGQPLLQIGAAIANWGITILSGVTKSNTYTPFILLLLKFKVTAVLLVETVCTFLILLIATVEISMECETQES